MIDVNGQDSQIVYSIIFSAVVIFLFCITIVVFLFYSSKKILKKELLNKEAELNYQKELLKTTLLVQEERERISAELHDDIGSALSTIHFQSAYLAKENMNESQLQILNEIGENTQQISRSLKELVWSLNSKNDTLDSFVAYIKNYYFSYFSLTNIEARFYSSLILDDVILTSLVRRNLFLAIKEILHNSLKHSKATQIDFNLIYNETSLIITIADNGVGLPEQLKYGNGLINLQKRLLAINGKIDYKNETQGLSTRLELPLTY